MPVPRACRAGSLERRKPGTLRRRRSSGFVPMRASPAGFLIRHDVSSADAVVAPAIAAARRRTRRPCCSSRTDVKSNGGSLRTHPLNPSLALSGRGFLLFIPPRRSEAVSRYVTNDHEDLRRGCYRLPARVGSAPTAIMKGTLAARRGRKATALERQRTRGLGHRREGVDPTLPRRTRSRVYLLRQAHAARIPDC